VNFYAKSAWSIALSFNGECIAGVTTCW
jgi:hypothetical protein